MAMAMTMASLSSSLSHRLHKIVFPSSSTRCGFYHSGSATFPFQLRSRASSRRVFCQTSTRRGFCQSSNTSYYPFQMLPSHVQELGNSLRPNLATLQSSFFAPDDRDIHNSCGRGFSVFLDPTFILTSARVVGRVVATFTDSETTAVGKQDGFERIRHVSYIGSTLALTADGTTVRAEPLAVSFENDLAVLKVAANYNDANLIPHCVKVVDTLPRKDDVMVAIAQTDCFLGNVRGIGKKTFTVKAPWPLDDKLGWMEHDWTMWHCGDPPRGGPLTGSFTRLGGIPWFNLHGELVGIASWEVVDQAPKFSVGFAVPAPCIRDVVEYAKNKDPEDRIVMDNWVDGYMIPRMGN